MIKINKKVYVAGHTGMVGSAIVRLLKKRGVDNIIVKSRSELDLLDQRSVKEFLSNERPDHVVLAAAKVGGIHANNTYPAEFIYENLMMQCNLIHGAFLSDIEHLLFLGSSCIYPKLAPQPMKESSLLSGLLEPTNEPYAIAKIAGLKMCESYNRQYGTSYRSVMPTNLYGPNDNFNLKNSHVIPAMIRKFHEAKLNNAPHVEVWGDGTAKREFLHVDDMAEACLFVMGIEPEIYNKYITPMNSHINIGTGVDISIANMAKTVQNVVGYSGDIVFNTQMPNGSPKKLTDVSLIKKLGWQAKVSFEKGLMDTYQWFLSNQHYIRR